MTTLLNILLHSDIICLSYYLITHTCLKALLVVYWEVILVLIIKILPIMNVEAIPVLNMEVFPATYMEVLPLNN